MAEKEKKSNSDLNELKEDIVKLRSDLSQFATRILERGQSEFSHAKENLIKNGKKTYDSVENKLSEKPVTTLLGAFGIGLLLGYLGKSKNSKKE